MTLFNIATKNIKRNFQTYFLYFVSMVFSIVVFYTFNSLKYNQQVAQMVGPNTETMLQTGAVAIAIFSAIFMGYSHSFFTRKRNKEIGLYTLLGLPRKQVAKMLFYENLVMGTVALGIGIIVGSLFSKLFTMLFLSLMGNSVRVYFALSSQAIINTVMVFSILFIIISLRAYSLIYRFKLVDLFRAEQSGESEPKASGFLALISIILISAGYLAAFNVSRFDNFLIYVVVVLGLVIAGTYGLFHSFMVFAIRVSRTNKSKYYQGMNLISTSNLLYRIKSNATLLATIAILSATTLTAVGMSYGFYHNINASLAIDHPFSYEYKIESQTQNQKVDATIAKYPKNKLLKSVQINYIVIDGHMTASANQSDIGYYVIPESSYTQITKVRQIDPVHLNSPNETLLFGNQFPGNAKNDKVVLKTNNGGEAFSIIDRKDYRLSNSLYVALVVQDKVFAGLDNKEEPASLRSLVVDNQKDGGALTAELKQIIDVTGYKSYYTQYMANMESQGMLMFIGGFLGLVILLATGSIIYFRQLNEAEKERVNYRILRNIGVSRREIRVSISKQVLYVFLFPLIVGIVHSWAALMVLSDLVGKSLVTSTIMTISAYMVIYFVYYLLTVNSYNKIVNSDL